MTTKISNDKSQNSKYYKNYKAEGGGGMYNTRFKKLTLATELYKDVDPL